MVSTALSFCRAALRRGNQRTAARERLRQGLDLAQSCGAERLAARAEEELRASGARPRRRRVSGADALTPSEARVARMAAAGMSNREIAQSLFVTPKTVENQLGRVCAKLGVSGRESLPEALGSLTDGQSRPLGGKLRGHPSCEERSARR